MTTTRRTLLDRVRDPRDDEAWERFHALYAPLLYGYARARGVAHADAEEVRDQCLGEVARRMRTFEYDPRRGRFKSFLYRLARDEVVDLLRARREEHADTRTLESIETSEATPDETWERQWRESHLRWCLDRASDAVNERNYRAVRLLLDGATVPDVCARLGMNANQVYKAKMRVLRRVREILASVE